MAACGTEPTSGFGGDTPDGGGGADATDDTNEPVLLSEAGNDAPLALTITPADPVLSSTNGSMPTQPFLAFVNGSQQTATWSLDNVALGKIDATGLFTGSGTVGGVAQVTAQVGASVGSTTVTVNLAFTENPGNVSAGDQTKLKAGGAADGAFKWLYPYDKTVFPRGLTGPTLQFAGAPPQSTYVHVKSKYLTYDGFFGGSNPGRLDLPAATWTAITQSAAASDPVQISVTKLSGGQVTGPITETWNIAQGSLKGTVYYNSYSSPLAGNNGATLKIKVGQQAAVLIGGCNVCHSVSANGNVLAASYGHQYDATYDLKNNAVKINQVTDYRWSFPALYPDGSILMSCGTLPGGYPPNIPGMGGDYDSQLYDTKTAKTIAAPGFDGVVRKALMPAFSADGSKLVFNHYETGGGHSLAVMDFDVKTKKFSNLVDIAKDSNHYLGWPAFLPDSSAVVYHTDDKSDYATWSGAKADLVLTDVKTKTATPLAALNGMKGNATYLPYGTSETLLNYEPTVLPVAVGGYYWVLFTSRRYYGNVITSPSQDSQDRKKLWVAAIDINAKPGTDPSHPAFYLPGQELAAGNMRGFWALDPCKGDGLNCESADECCGGFCRQVNLSDGAIGKQCVPPQSGCAQEFEKCTTAADCCGAGQGYLCVNGRCAIPPPN